MKLKYSTKKYSNPYRSRVMATADFLHRATYVSSRLGSARSGTGGDSVGGSPTRAGRGGGYNRGRGGGYNRGRGGGYHQARGGVLSLARPTQNVLSVCSSFNNFFF